MNDERRTKRIFDTPSTAPVRDKHPWPREHEDEPIPLFDHFPDTRAAAQNAETFVDPDVIRSLGLRSDLEDMFVELGMGNKATNPQVLYPELVHQFMGTVNVYYANEGERRASEGILTFFIRGIRYRVPLSALSIIYGFQNAELQHAVLPDFAGRSTFWEHIATGIFDSGSALQIDISHPSLRYFMKVLAHTLLCKMEPNKFRVQELILEYYAVRSLVHMENIAGATDDIWPNLGAIFAEHLVKLKMKPFQSQGKKKETVGSLLTSIFIHCRLLLDDAAMNDQIIYMDAACLMSAQWLMDDHYWCFRDEDGPHLVELPLRALTDFDTCLPSIQFHPDPRLLRAPSTMPRRYPVQPPVGPQPAQPEASFPPFPLMPDMSARPEGDFQRVVVDAFTAIWARVSRCRCSSRRSVRARSPSAAGPSSQCIRDSEGTTDETIDED
ncbi:hypothetical protein F2Q69_00034627 [Brassica cretica]|uniref:Arabidopsis retrotransposon Orf1 C-terminal domain-containing protein n=1 Tax=Brassica cretica TaxID=69181 RepID=A0A8S9SPJ9_BRACR|nr:hypothetical protein F2Q69_00034627 [Brassica cretica]